MKKVIFAVLITLTFFNLSGCAALKDKFVRKSKQTKKKEVFLSTGEVYPVDVRYNNHFIYYDIWLEELIESMGKNKKKVLASADRALYNLKEMGELLKPKKKRELEPYINQLNLIVKELLSGSVSIPRQKKIIDMLKRQIRGIRHKFNYEDMIEGGWIQIAGEQ
ncbi:MAG: hypothetical protein KAU12_04710 [Candidatus Omnitrophica bacterium]|nr:hypothetical protein [Candidatus Omnitrophota bacterium]